MLRSLKFFKVFLVAYPREFRREFGSDMAQVFRDCYLAEKSKSGSLGVWRLWLLTLIDLLKTAPKEHLARLGKENSHMNNLRKDALAVLGSVGVIVVAFLLLSYGRKHEVTPVLMIGRALDALITAGIVGNLIVFLLVKATKFNPLRIALWTFLVTNAVLFLVATLIGSRVDPHFSLGGVLIGYFVSFLFWLGLHLMWARLNAGGSLAISGENSR
jgi:hypothetical protein